MRKVVKSFFKFIKCVPLFVRFMVYTLTNRLHPYFTAIPINSNSHWVGGSTNPSSTLSPRRWTDSCSWSALAVWRGRRQAESQRKSFCLSRNLQVDSQCRKKNFSQVLIQLSQASCAALGKSFSFCLLQYMICNTRVSKPFSCIFGCYWYTLRWESAVHHGDFIFRQIIHPKVTFKMLLHDVSLTRYWLHQNTDSLVHTDF